MKELQMSMLEKMTLQHDEISKQQDLIAEQQVAVRAV